MTDKFNRRQIWLASTVFCSAALLGITEAKAQSGPAIAEPSTGSAVAEVVVTGSRIPRANLESTSPLTIVGAAEIKAEGVINVEDLLNNLPSVVPDQTSTESNGSTGTATVSLRGLGSVRTLVLIDGRRLQAGDVTTPAPDLNFIPSALVERAEVLSGGASSTYGADAVAGVVNFVMKHDFEGIQFDAQYGFDQHDNSNGDARKFLPGNPFGLGASALSEPGDVVERNNAQFSVIMGANSPDNKGNVELYGEYTNLQPILESSRDFSDCTVTDATTAGGLANGRHVCAGSSNSANGRFNLLGQGKSLTNYQAPAGTFAPFTSAGDFNFGPTNYFQRSDTRYNFGAFGHYQVNDHVNVYMDAMFMDDQTTSQIAASGFFQGVTYYIPCTNGFLTTTQAMQLGCGGPFEGGGASAPAGTPAGDIATTIGYRFANDATRDRTLRHTDYRLVLGAKGDIAEGWTYDAYVQYGAVVEESTANDESISRLQNALITLPGSTTTCSVGGGCVPINIFSAAGPSKAAYNYVNTAGFAEGGTTEEVAEADVNGDLGQYGLKSPLSKDGVKVSLGADYRREELDQSVDEEALTGDLSGNGGASPDTHGSFNLYEVYGEISAPLVSDLPFIKSLDFDGGYRYSEYSDIGQTETYKVALDYAPVDDFKLRASFNHAVRAPNVDELYTPPTASTYSGSDPCAGASPHATQAQCLLTGLPAADYGKIPQCPANQCETLNGGNSALKPESADTTTFGVVFTPTFIKNFSATIDYYDIMITNVISAISPNVSLDECLSGVTSYCALVQRDANGSIDNQNGGYVISLNTNTGYLHTKGFDFEANYRFKLSDLSMSSFRVPEWGSVSINFVGTLTDIFTQQPVTGLGHYDCAGLYGPVCGNPDPHWKHKLRVTWSSPWQFDVSGQWRYVGGVKLDTNQGNPLLNNGYYDAVDNHLAGVNYFDLSGNWHVKDGLTVRAGVTNVFDKDPPLVSDVAGQVGVYNGNTYPGVYDALGRQFFIGLTAKF